MLMASCLGSAVDSQRYTHPGLQLLTDRCDGQAPPAFVPGPDPRPMGMSDDRNTELAGRNRVHSRQGGVDAGPDSAEPVL
jgi:hypothetical protein